MIQLKRLGDLVLTTPVFAALRDQFPGVHLTLAAAGNARGLFPLLEVDEVLAFGGGSSDWGKLLGQSFDVCLDFTGTDRSALVTALSRARRRITYQRFIRKPLRKWIYPEFVDSDVRQRHTADHHTDLLRPLGIQRENVPSQLREPKPYPGLARPYAVIHAGTARAEKYWTVSGWQAVARQLTEKGWPVIFTGGNQAEETAHLARIFADVPAGTRNLAGTITLTELASLIANAELLVSVDSVPVHLADALRTPVVALFGPTDPFHWRPRFAPHEIVKAKQMADIEPAQVEAAIGRIPAGDRA